MQITFPLHSCEEVQDVIEPRMSTNWSCLQLKAEGPQVSEVVRFDVLLEFCLATCLDHLGAEEVAEVEREVAERTVSIGIPSVV